MSQTPSDPNASTPKTGRTPTVRPVTGRSSIVHTEFPPFAETKPRVAPLLGTALITAGLFTALTLVLSVITHHSYLNRLDLRLDVDTMHAITRFSPADRITLIIAGALALAGIAVLVTSSMRARDARE